MNKSAKNMNAYEKPHGTHGKVFKRYESEVRHLGSFHLASGVAALRSRVVTVPCRTATLPCDMWHAVWMRLLVWQTTCVSRCSCTPC